MTPSFGVKAMDSSDIYRVLITYDDEFKKQWKSVDLVKNEFTGIWEGQIKEYGQDQNSNGQKYGSTWEYSNLI